MGLWSLLQSRFPSERRADVETGIENGSVAKRWLFGNDVPWAATHRRALRREAARRPRGDAPPGLLEQRLVEQQRVARLSLVLETEYEVPEVDPRDPLPCELPGGAHAGAAWDRRARARALVTRKQTTSQRVGGAQVGPRGHAWDNEPPPVSPGALAVGVAPASPSLH